MITALHPNASQGTNTLTIPTMSIAMLHFNRLIRTAERLATMDIISRGRIEFGTARGNNAAAVRTFDVDAENSKAEWRETLDVCVRFCQVMGERRILT